MTKNVFIICSNTSFGNSFGKLNTSFANLMKEELTKLNYEVKLSFVNQIDNPSKEVEKYAWADIIIYQFPVWWMSMPWTLKRYIDINLVSGAGVLFESDGRTRKDPTKKYGSGGLTKNKKIMLSTTWNAYEQAFTEKDNFFDGKSVDEVFYHFYKAHEFIGIVDRIESFHLYDVVKEPNFSKWEANLKEHINKNFK